MHPNLCTPNIRRYNWIIPRVLDRCRMVITPSETVKSEVIQELGYPSDSIAVTPLGIRRVFAGAKTDVSLTKRLGIRTDYVLFSGTREPRKNLPRLIRALKAVSTDTSLVIAGPNGWGEDLQEVARDAGLQDRVVFPGYLRDPDLANLMAGSRAFVFPSIYEGFGLPPLEAMAAGVPVVSSSTGSLPEVLGDAPIYCDPFDESSIAQAINEVLTDDSKRASMIALGYKQAAKYSWAESARLTIEAYRRIAAG